MADNFLARDALLIQTKTLPASAGDANTAAIDTGTGGARSAKGALLAGVELRITAPALDATELPNSETMKYAVQCDDNSSFTSPKNLGKEVLVQTGAGTAGAASATARFRLPTDCERYVRVVATGSTSIGDCSGSSMTAELLV